MEDLGLSVMWAGSNAGAETEHEVGTLFSWWDISSYQDCRLPSKAEFEELLNECVWAWTDEDGTPGYLVSGQEGGEVFFPAHKTAVSCYWSSSEDPDLDNMAYALAIDGTNVGIRLFDKDSKFMAREVGTEDDSSLYLPIEDVRLDCTEDAIMGEFFKYSWNWEKDYISKTMNEVKSHPKSSVKKVLSEDYSLSKIKVWMRDIECSRRIIDVLSSCQTQLEELDRLIERQISRRKQDRRNRSIEIVCHLVFGVVLLAVGVFLMIKFAHRWVAYLGAALSLWGLYTAIGDIIFLIARSDESISHIAGDLKQKVPLIEQSFIVERLKSYNE